jgi:hypothetical protein
MSGNATNQELSEMNVVKGLYECSWPSLRYTPVREATKNIVRVPAADCRTCFMVRACADSDAAHVR